MNKIAALSYFLGSDYAAISFFVATVVFIVADNF